MRTIQSDRSTTTAKVGLSLLLAMSFVFAIVQAGCGISDEAEGGGGVASAVRPSPKRLYQIVPTYTTSTYAGQTYGTQTGYAATYLRELDSDFDGYENPVTCAEIAAGPADNAETFGGGLGGFAANYPQSVSLSPTTFANRCQQLAQLAFQKRTWDPAKVYLAKDAVYRSAYPNPADPTVCYRARSEVRTIQCGTRPICTTIPTYGGTTESCSGSEPVYKQVCAVYQDLTDKPFVKVENQDFAGLVKGFRYQVPGGLSKHVKTTRNSGGSTNTWEHSSTREISGSVGFKIFGVGVDGSASSSSGWSTSRSQEQQWSTTISTTSPPVRHGNGQDFPDHSLDEVDVVWNANLVTYQACPATSGVNPVTEEFVGLGLMSRAEAPWAPADSYDPEAITMAELVDPCKATRGYREAKGELYWYNADKELFFWAVSPSYTEVLDPNGIGTGKYVCSGGVLRHPPEAIKRIWSLNPFLDENGNSVLNPDLSVWKVGDKYRFIPIPIGGSCSNPESAFGTVKCNAWNFNELTSSTAIEVTSSKYSSYMESHSHGYSVGLSGNIKILGVGVGGSTERKLSWTSSTANSAGVGYSTQVNVEFEYPKCGTAYVFLDSLSLTLAIPAEVRTCDVSTGGGSAAP